MLISAPSPHSATRTIEDPYVLMIIFSNLDIRTLFHSCTRVCKYWNVTFFQQQELRDEQTTNNNFALSFCKMVYLNGMVRELSLYYQMSEITGDNPKIYSQFCQLKETLMKDEKVHLFKELLCDGGLQFSKPLLKKKFSTLSSLCFLVPMVRNPNMAIKCLKAHSTMMEEASPLLRTSTRFFLNVVGNGTGFKVLSTLTGDCYLEYTIPQEVSQITILQLELRYHPFMQKEFKTKFVGHDNKDTTNNYCEVFIYSLYVYYISGSQPLKRKIKRFLLCDNLKDQRFQCIEYGTYIDSLIHIQDYYNYTINPNSHISICDWENSGSTDVVLLNDPLLGSIHVCTQQGPILTVKLHSNSPIIPHVPSLTLQIQGQFQTSNALNFTKPLIHNGLVQLLDPITYSDFSLIELKIASENESIFRTKPTYILFAKKSTQQEEQHPFSIMWKSFKKHETEPEAFFKKGEYIDWEYQWTRDWQAQSRFIDQGRLLVVESNFHLLDIGRACKKDDFEYYRHLEYHYHEACDLYDTFSKYSKCLITWNNRETNQTSLESFIWWSKYSTISATLLAVLDSGLIQVIIGDSNEQIVKLLDIEVPSIHSKDHHYGKQALELTKKSLPFQSTIELEFGSHLVDKTGVVLAYVSVGGASPLNRILVRAGLAIVKLTTPSNTTLAQKYHQGLMDDQITAKRYKYGMWK